MHIEDKIPKIIHYCWFGGKEKPKSVKAAINEWRNVLSDYKIMEWNEDNFNISICDYVKQAYEKKKYAFVADYARLYALKEYGGIYLDTDVKVIKRFDMFLSENVFLSFESERTLCTAVIGAKKNSKFLLNTLSQYDVKQFVEDNGSLNLMPNSEFLFHILFNSKQDRGLKLSVGEVTVYPVDYFCSKDFKTYEILTTDNTVCVHMLDASWYPAPRKVKKIIKKILIKIGFGFLWKEG